MSLLTVVFGVAILGVMAVYVLPKLKDSVKAQWNKYWGKKQ